MAALACNRPGNEWALLAYVSINILQLHRTTSSAVHATHTILETNQGGTRRKEDKEDVISYLSLLVSL